MNTKNKLPEINEANEKEYWAEYQKTLSPQIREAIVKKYAGLVRYAANRIKISFKNTRDIEFCDLEGYGSIGLLEAIERYNPSKNIKFKSFALWRIHGSIIDALRDLDILPRSIRQKLKKIDKAREILESRIKGDVKPEEIANMMGIPIEEYIELMRYNIDFAVTSLSEIWYLGDDSDELSIIDTLKSSDRTNPEYMAERQAVQKEIVKAIKKLPAKEQEILILYYYERLTLKEIGKVLEISESRVSQIHTKAIQDLRYSLSEIKKSLL